MSLLLNEVTEVTEDNEKMDLLNAIFASVFTVETASQKSQILKVRGWGKEDLPFLKEGLVRDGLCKLGELHSIHWT